MKTERPNLLRAWWPAAAWIGIICFESTDYLSARNTGGALYDVLTRLFGSIDLDRFIYWHHLLRKLGHVVGYGMLGLLLLRGFRASLVQSRAWAGRAAVFAWLGTALVAALDEWHQSFIPSRGGTPWDVLLDSVAGLIALSMAFITLRRGASTVSQNRTQM